MNRTRIYHIWERELALAKNLPLIVEFAINRKLISQKNVGQSLHLNLNRYEKLHTRSFEEAVDVLAKNTRFECLRFERTFATEDQSESVKVEIEVLWVSDGISVSIDASNDDVGVAFHEFIRNLFNLRNPPLPRAEALRPRDLQATIFLGKHFDEAAEAPSRALRTFLSLLRFHIIEAQEYRSMTIPEKVKRLIEKQDIYIGLVTEKREHEWITAEASYAQGKGKHVIFVVEENSAFNPTLHGRDKEYIPFPPNRIEQSFIKLLQEFNSLGISGL